MANRILCTLLLCLASYSAGSMAEGRCESPSVDIDEFTSAMELGSRLSTRLDQRGVRVALVARMGTDLSKHGLRYSHLGIAHRDGDSGWRIVHLLSACETSTSALHEDGLGRFFMDDVVDFEALIIRLTPALEQSRRLLGPSFRFVPDKSESGHCVNIISCRGGSLCSRRKRPAQPVRAGSHAFPSSGCALLG